MSQSPSTIIGNITDDPKLSFTADGKPRLAFGVAVNHYWTDQSGEKQEKTSYFNVIAWRYVAEDSASVLEKGVGVMVSGRLEQRSWEADDGTKRYVVELIADHIGVLTRSIETFARKRRGNAEGEALPAKKAISPRQARPALHSVPQITENEEPF